MVIDGLVLHDFGVFGGYHEIELTPSSASKPIILFGGLNGAGKTTLLDAIQLCLFGPVAKCSNRGTKSYSDFLIGCINRQAFRQEALVGLDFRHTVQGKEEKYSIRRSWRANGKKAIEEFTVSIDGTSVDTLASNWLHHIEDVIPANISHLFFFDGEQASEYVMAENAGDLIETAILNLLGLDIVDQLSKDLKVIERRETASTLSGVDKAEIEHIENEAQRLRKELDQLQQEEAHLRSYELVPRQKDLETIKKKFEKAGGDLYYQREDIEAKAVKQQNELNEYSDQLIELADSVLPFALVSKLLTGLENRDLREQKILQAKRSLEVTANIKDELVVHLQKNKSSNKNLQLVNDFLTNRIDANKNLLKDDVHNILDVGDRKSLLLLANTTLSQSKNNTINLLANYSEAKRSCEETEMALASVPKEDDIKLILHELNNAQMELNECETKLAKLENEIVARTNQYEYVQKNLDLRLTTNAETTIKQGDKERLLKHSTKARDTLSKFRQAVTEKHISHIQSLVLENYQNLLRKSSLVSRVAIDPDTFHLKLHDINNNSFPIDKLSAGERQLLAISVLWAMAKASGRPLPAAIDTPMGRLDAAHRKYLVQRYLPCASHQVLLFSTDQEIYGEYYENLKQRISRSYHLEYDDKTSMTAVSPGYLQ